MQATQTMHQMLTMQTMLQIQTTRLLTAQIQQTMLLTSLQTRQATLAMLTTVDSYIDEP